MSGQHRGGDGRNGGNGCGLWLLNFAAVGQIGAYVRPRLGDGWTAAVLGGHVLAALIVSAAVAARRKRREDGGEDSQPGS